jgi:hypothetical protein
MTDDLELLRHHRPEPAPPSGHATADARGALSLAIGGEQREDLARPEIGVPHLARPELGAPRGARPEMSVPGATRHHLGWGARVAIVAALAVLAVIAAGALRSGSTEGPGRALAAGPVLERLARVAAAQGNETPGPGQYLYTASRSLTNSTTALRAGALCTATFQEYRQNWIAANGEGLFTESDGPPRYPSPRDARNCDSVPERGGATPGTSYTWAAPGCLSIDPIPLTRLPTDPAKLRARLLTGKVEGGPPGPAEAFTQVGDLLRETDASAALRAALYRAAAGLPGVRFLGTVTDRLARRGLGLAIDSHGIRHELIFSAQTSALLSEQGVPVGRAPGVQAPRGTVLYWSVYLGGHVVSHLPIASPLPLRPACVRSAGTVKTPPGRPQDAVIVGASAAPLALAHRQRLRRGPSSRLRQRPHARSARAGGSRG